MSEGDDVPRTEAQEPDEPSEERPRRRISRLWIALGVLVVLLGLAALGARPAYRQFKIIRAHKFADEAEEFIRKQEWAQAFNKAQAANQLAPSDPRCQRLLAIIFSQYGLEHGLNFWDYLLDSPHGTRADREEAAALAIRLAKTDRASAEIEKLLATEPVTPRTYLLAAQYYAGLRDTTNAIRFARQAHDAEPASGTNTFQLAALLLGSRNAPERNEGRTFFWTLAEKDGPFQLRAIQALVGAADTPRADREKALAVVRGLKEQTTAVRLMQGEIEVLLDPTRRTAIADDIISRLGPGPPEDVAAVGVWLNRQELHSRTLDLVKLDKAFETDNLFLVRYDALNALGQHEEAYRYLLDPRARGEPLALEFLRSRAAQKLADPDLAATHFGRLVAMAGDDVRRLRLVAEFAERNGGSETAVAAYRKLAGSPAEALSANRHLLRLLDLRGETYDAREVARRLVTLSKNDPLFRRQAAYYDLLLEENLDRARATAEEVFAAQPDDVLNRVVVALAHLRTSDPKGARDTLTGARVDWRKLPPGGRAVIAAVMGANGRTDTAAQLIELTPLASLKPEERELIRPWVGAPRGLKEPTPAEAPAEPPAETPANKG